MIKQIELESYLERINAILVTTEHPVFQWAGLSTLTDEFMEIEPLATEPQYRQFADAMISAETAVKRRINN
jgi:hypothetical protein